MKIVIFNYALEMGGTDRVAVELSKILSDEGKRDIIFLTMKARENDYFKLDHSVSRMDLGFCADDKKQRGVSYLGWRAFKSFLKMIFFILKEKPDYIVSNWTSINCFALLSALPFNVRVVCVEHMHFEQPSKFWSLLRRLIYRAAYRVVCLTDRDLYEYKKIGAKAIKIFNPLTVDVLERSKRQGRKFIAVGRLEEQKGFDILIRAFRNVVAAYSDACLEIYGDGTQRDMLSQLIQDFNLEESVTLMGATKDISRAYASADFFVLSSRFEGFGLVIVEAQAHGIPVVSFDCPRGPSEIISDGVNGLLVENGSCKQLSEKMIYLIENPEMCSKMVIAGIISNKRFEHETIRREWLHKVFGE
ncbi:glycosyltransferase family 4 protein [Pseudomonas beijingensis]|uniref:glycosyltransferase family 4 protein n=1 Tax=Pseudomonas beijingensis TaxID=2954101 RepID=UPI0027323E40|nr:glycosyltransferase family 4 protein [Pseudomonas sp. FP2262]WLH47917.1 glycosyltransferase family 4 protein [Pseudomonas sp. FP2262]